MKLDDLTPLMATAKTAEALTGGQYGSPKRYPTAYGEKTVAGITDLIERETRIRDLMEATKTLIETWEAESREIPRALEGHPRSKEIHAASIKARREARVAMLNIDARSI